MKDNLAKIFDNPDRPRLMRLFIFNRGKSFTPKDIFERVGLSGSKLRKELGVLLKSGFVEKTKVGGARAGRSKRELGFVMSERFPYLEAFSSLLVETLPLRTEALTNAIHKSGRVKILIVAGVFVNNVDSSLDLLVVGDDLKRSHIERAVRSLEALIGREIRYASFTLEEFEYRLDIFDRLVRDVLDYPHRVLLNRSSLDLI